MPSITSPHIALIRIPQNRCGKLQIEKIIPAVNSALASQAGAVEEWAAAEDAGCRIATRFSWARSSSPFRDAYSSRERDLVARVIAEMNAK